MYGADISNADIAVITAEGSPWVATSATDPSNVGAVAVRAAALLAAGEEVPQDIVVPPALITQQQLRDGNIQNISELIEVVPELNTPDLVPISLARLTSPRERARAKSETRTRAPAPLKRRRRCASRS